MKLINKYYEVKNKMVHENDVSISIDKVDMLTMQQEEQLVYDPDKLVVSGTLIISRKQYANLSINDKGGFTIRLPTKE